MFEKVAERIVDGCLDGYNGTILAYGQTNSGKTYTMQGVELKNDQYSNFKGIMPRSVEHLFERLETMRGEVSIIVCSDAIYSFLDMLPISSSLFFCRTL